MKHTMVKLLHISTGRRRYWKIYQKDSMIMNKKGVSFQIF